MHLKLLQMFPTVFKPGEIHKFTEGNGVCHEVACGYNFWESQRVRKEFRECD